MFELLVTTVKEKSEVIKEYVKQKKERSVNRKFKVLSFSCENKKILLFPDKKIA